MNAGFNAARGDYTATLSQIQGLDRPETKKPTNSREIELERSTRSTGTRSAFEIDPVDGNILSQPFLHHVRRGP
jgi:hypothetical protein